MTRPTCEESVAGEGLKTFEAVLKVMHKTGIADILENAEKLPFQIINYDGEEEKISGFVNATDYAACHQYLSTIGGIKVDYLQEILPDTRPIYDLN